MTPSQVASSVVHALKDQPLVLALVTMNIALLIIVWLEMNLVFKQQAEISALLSKCVDVDVLRALGLVR